MLLLKKYTLFIIGLIAFSSCLFFTFNNAFAATYTRTAPASTSFDTSGFSNVTGWSVDDDYQTYALGFTFPMADKNFTQVNINTNGVLTFVGSGTPLLGYTNQPFNNVNSSYTYFVAPFWDDLYVRSPGQVRYKQAGVAPNRTFTVSYNNIRRYNPRSRKHRFQVVLHEDGSIRYRYSSTNTPYDNGQSATIGVFVKNSDYDQFSYNSNAIDFTTDILYTPTSAIDHYRFEIPTTGLTCVASDIVLKACTDAACLTPSSLSASLSLSPAGLWSQGAVVSDNITFTGSTPIPGVNSLKLSQPHAVATTISASNFNPAPSSSTPVQCFTGGTAVSCSVLFKDTGFLFSNIPHQISNKSSLIGFNGQQLTIQAVEKNTTTGACQAIFPNGSDTDIELKLNCVSGACSNIAITTSSATEAPVGSSFSDVPFNFAFNSVINNNVANYELNYANAGELSLSAQKVVTLNSGMTTTLEGTSNNFVVKPFGFKFEFPNDADPFSDGDPTSGGDFTDFKKAGENFTVNAIAIGWEKVGEDVNNDGNIDVGTNANDNPLVQFFAGEQVKLTHELQLPSGGSVGSFSDPVEPLEDSTASFTDAKWSEVGVISLIANLNDADYLTAGNVSGTVNNVGRFTPHHFTVSDITAGEFVGTAQCLNQTFIGESTVGALNYGAMRPSMKITAKSLAGSTTLNYHGNFLRFDETNLSFGLPTQDSVNSLALTAIINAGSVSGGNGVFTYTASADDHFVYTRNTASQVPPFAANINYTASALADEDNVGLVSGASFPTLSATSSTVPQHLIRYGRVQLNNAFGPENEVLAMPIEHQFFDGTNFVINPNMGAGCAVSVLLNTKFTLLPASLGDLDQAALPSSSAWGAGHASLLIPPPNTAQGSVEFTLDVPSWLKFDWDNNVVTPDTDPKAKATFGRYRGNDRIINWRERR